MRDAAHELDPARPVTYAENHLYRARRKKTIGIPDIWSTNYELDVLDQARDSSRLGVVFVSECCNHPTSLKGDSTEELEQVRVIESEWATMDATKGLAGHTVWSFADYATEHRERFRRQNGLFDAWRRPKMAAELYRARYSVEPVVSVFLVEGSQDSPPSQFRMDLKGPPMDAGGQILHVFSNCDRIRIDQAGATLATVEGALHYTLPISIDRGELSASGRLGSGVSRQDLSPHAEAARVELTTTNKVCPPGETTAIDVSIVDSEGVVVRNWNGGVSVSADGGVRLHSYNSKSEVLVGRGEGRIYATRLPGAEGATIVGRARGLETGRMFFGPENSG